jgi:hypothetical protein
MFLKNHKVTTILYLKLSDCQISIAAEFYTIPCLNVFLKTNVTKNECFVNFINCKLYEMANHEPQQSVTQPVKLFIQTIDYPLLES